jgi:hypothetical protein
MLARSRAVLSQEKLGVVESCALTDIAALEALASALHPESITAAWDREAYENLKRTVG